MGTHPIFESDFDCLTEFRIMANRSQAEFVRHMLRLRAKIQRRTPHELYEQAGMVEYHMSKQPKVYDERFTDMVNNPLIQQNFEMLKEIREMGLYIDEHRDFKEEMIRMREGRGTKAKPPTHKNKRDIKWKGEGVTWSKDEV